MPALHSHNVIHAGTGRHLRDCMRMNKKSQICRSTRNLQQFKIHSHACTCSGVFLAATGLAYLKCRQQGAGQSKPFYSSRSVADRHPLLVRNSSAGVASLLRSRPREHRRPKFTSSLRRCIALVFYQPQTCTAFPHAFNHSR